MPATKKDKPVKDGAAAPAKPKEKKVKGKTKPKELKFLQEQTNARWMADDDTKRAKIQVRRYSLGKPAPAAMPAARKVKGKGLKLKNIPRVLSHINRCLVKSPELVALHRLVIGKVVKGVEIKENLEGFNGVVYDEEYTAERLAKKIDNLELRVLRKVCDLCALDSDGTREELTEALIAFLEKPAELGRSPRKRAASPSKKSSPKKGKKATKKKVSKKDKVKRPLSAYMFFCKDKRDAIVKKNPSAPVTEIAKKLGAAWKKADKADRKQYEAQAEKDKTRYKKELGKIVKASPSPAKKRKVVKASPKKEKKEKKEKVEEKASDKE